MYFLIYLFILLVVGSSLYFFYILPKIKSTVSPIHAEEIRQDLEENIPPTIRSSAVNVSPVEDTVPVQIETTKELPLGVVYKDYTTFNILGDEINLISNETDYGRNTVAEMNDRYYYLGPEVPDVANAMVAWQKFTNKVLSIQEINQIIIENGE